MSNFERVMGEIERRKKRGAFVVWEGKPLHRKGRFRAVVPACGHIRYECESTDAMGEKMWSEIYSDSEYIGDINLEIAHALRDALGK